MIECPAITQIWKKIELEFSNIIAAPLLNVEKELGILEEEEEYFYDKNLLLLIARRYIYQCNLDETIPTYAGLICNIRFYERIEYQISAQNDSVEKHFLKWEEILYCLSIGNPTC